METSLVSGIKLIGVGKLGSKNCSAELANNIALELCDKNQDKVIKAAFLGALWMKGISADEQILTQFSVDFFPDLSNEIKQLYEKIISGKILSQTEAYDLGKFLFKDDNELDHIRVLFAASLRIRHAEVIEYLGFIKAMEESYSKEFQDSVLTKNSIRMRPLISMSDPFDGIDRSLIITPLIADFFNKRNIDCIIPSGESSGPKFGLNMWELGKNLKEHFIKNNSFDSKNAKSYYLDQADLSKSMYRWRDLRKKIMKRPFLATLEKMVDPFKADVFIGSVFHGGFNEKMLDIAEGIGFSKIAIIFRGVEGTLGLSLGRNAKVIISTKAHDNSYSRQELEFNPETFGFTKIMDPTYNFISLTENSELILNYRKNGSSGNTYFDQRISYNEQVYEKILEKFNL